MDTSQRRIILDSLGLGIGVGTYGLTFGAIATASGLSVLQTCALSLFAFTGASQFAFVGVVASGGAPLTAALTATLLGARNMFYSISLAALLRVRGWRRLAAAHLVIDESTAMALGQKNPRDAKTAFMWTGVTIFVMWNLMTLLGALAGNAIGDPKLLGLDAAVAAAFLGLVWPRLTDRLAQIIAVCSVLIAVALVPISTPGVPIIIAGCGAVALGLLWKRLIEHNAGADD
ncbi:MAG: branched-chain amino acid ABC transporter permease [Aeromicrobium sp.]|nr:MAG: branched-chain amino acid ABC transporter permease [Aeromicrobium sp.]